MKRTRAPEGGWFRRMVAWVANGIRPRKRPRMLASHYEGASTGRRAGSWSRASGDPNAVSSLSLVRLRERSRDLARNNGWIKKAIGRLTDSIAGTGIECQVRLGDAPFPDGQRLWDTWGKTTAVDYDGRLNWLGIQRLVVRTIILSGECIILRERANSRDGLPLSAPWKLRVLEPDHLDDSVFQYQGRYVEKGIELDERGRRVAYWLYPVHPGSTLRTNLTSVRIPASEVIHVYDVERPGQLRGIPWLHAAIATAQDLDEAGDARIMQYKAAALMCVFVEDIAGEGPGALGDAIDGVDQSGNFTKLESMEPGAIYYLAPGETIKAADPPRFDAAEQGFAQYFLRKMAAGIGVTYEDMTGDFSQVTFSSARMGRIAFEASVDGWQWHMVIPGLCEKVFAWVMGTAAVLEGWAGVPYATWAPPALPPVDPGKDATTKTARLRAGLDHIDDVLRTEGKDPDEHFSEIERRREDLEARGIILDSDASKVTRGGQFQNVTD